MDFYLDEQLPKTVAEALNAIEKHEGVNSVFSTEEAFGKGVPDTELCCRGLLRIHAVLLDQVLFQ